MDCVFNFASDNVSGAHPRMFAALERVNGGHTAPYGDDPWTAEAITHFKRLFGQDISVFFVFLGTAANVLSLRAITRPWYSVLCSQVAHVHVDEGGAPEMHLGCKLHPLATTAHGKITPESILPCLADIGSPHRNQPRVLSITQSTEVGTVYSLEEIKALTACAREHNLYVHMDGARIANATAALGVDVRTFTRDAGVDVLSFGGTKNGMLFGEAVVFFNPALAAECEYIRKQSMQLASKMRFVSAQFTEMLKDGLWLECASHANALAARLAKGIADLPGVEITRPVEANAVFVRFDPAHAEQLLQDCLFYIHPHSGEARLMTSFAHTAAEVDGFIARIREVAASK